MDWIFLLFAIISATLLGIAGLLIGELRGARAVAGFWLGFLLGPLGVFCIGLAGRQCPACRSWIARDATRCARCLSDVEPPSPTATDRVEAEAIAAARARARELRSKS